MAVKYLVLLFNFAFFLCGLGLIIIGSVVQGFFSEYVEFFDNKYETPAIGLIVLGVIIMIIAFFGCCGAKMENVCMLTTFAVLLGAVVVCEVAACISVAVLRAQVSSAVRTNMQHTQDKYGAQDSLVTETWDHLQQEYKCCGVHNSSDWLESSYGRIPDSCCKHPAEDCAKDLLLTAPLFTSGCYSSLQESALDNLAAVTTGALVLAGLQVLGIWMACGLSRGIRNRYEVL